MVIVGKRIRDLSELISRVNPDNSIEENFDELYVDRVEESPVKAMTDHLLNDNAFVKLLFTGPRGCGKETELICLANDKEIRRNFHVKIIPGDGKPDKLIGKIVDSVIEIAKGEGIEVDDIVKDIEAVKKFQEGWTTEAELAGKFNHDEIPNLFNFGKLTPEEKVFKVTKKKSVDPGKPPDYLKHVNNLTDQIYWHGYHRRKEVLILISNLDKIGLENAEKLFTTDFFHKMNCYAIFTFPYEATRSSKFPEILRKYSDEIYFMPNVRPFHADGTTNEPDFDFLTRILLKRFHRSVFKGSEIIYDLIRYSGGVPHELIRLVKECARKSLRINADWKVIKPKIDQISLEQVLSWKRKLYQNTFNDKQLNLFKSIHETNSYDDKTNKELLSLMDQNLIFMYGPVSDIWDTTTYHVNPLITEAFPSEFQQSEEEDEE